jgi:hypothetical protein
VLESQCTKCCRHEHGHSLDVLVGILVATEYANDDMTRDILRFVGEERLVLCVTRPSAVCAITNLP